MYSVKSLLDEPMIHGRGKYHNYKGNNINDDRLKSCIFVMIDDLRSSVRITWMNLFYDRFGLDFGRS